MLVRIDLRHACVRGKIGKSISASRGIAMLEMFFNPRAVAVIGASESPGKLGNQVLANLISSGFPGQVYPINPRAEKILGLPCFKSVLDVPGPIDCAVVIVPAKFVSGVLEESGKKGIKGAIIITAG